MARPLALLAAVLAASSDCLASAAAEGSTTFYVSTTGSASASGSKDAPLATCAQAVAKLTAMASPGGATVQFAPGTYTLDNATTCGTVKSLKGSAASPIVFRGAPGGGTQFDASIQLDATQLKPVTDAKVQKILNPAAKTKVLAMPMATAPGTLSWDGVPLTGSVWPNKGLGYVKTVNDKGAVWAAGRTIGPRPHCHVCTGDQKSTAAAPCGANISIAGDADGKLPTGDWAAELAAGPGFGGATISGYFAADWYQESHRLAAVATNAGDLSVQMVDTSRYGFSESLANKNTAPGRFTVSGLLSEVDSPGEIWYDGTAKILYVYPPSKTTTLGAMGDDAAAAGDDGDDEEWSSEELAAVQFGQWGGPGLISLEDTSYVTVRDMVVAGVGKGGIVSVSGGDHNVVGGCTFKNSNALAVSVVGGKLNKVIGNDIYDVGGHISVTPDPKAPNEEALMADPTLVSSNLIANNHMTQVFLRGGWQLRGTPPTGARLSHNLIHDAAGQIIMPGGPLAMLDHNEVFNTGYVEGDGGVMYTGASLTNGFGMHYRENFVHHSMEIPGLHGRGGIYFDDHEGSISNCSGNVLYKAAGRAFLVNGGAGNNITHNLVVNSGVAIYNQHADNMVKTLPLYDNGTLKRGDKSDYIWKTEMALGVKDYQSLFNTSLAKRFPSFAKLLAVNSTTEGWASAANSTFTDNVFLNNSANICLLFSYHGTATTPGEACDGDLPKAGFPKFIDQSGTIDANWSWFPEATSKTAFEFTNKTLGFDTTQMGLRCDEYRRALPDPTKYRPWVRDFFAGVPSAASGKYTPAAASIRAGMESGKQLVTQYTMKCPPLEKTDCEAVWLAWGECQADGTQVVRYTVEVEAAAGGAACEHEDGFAKSRAC